MFFNSDGRQSASPLVETIWRVEMEGKGSFISQAASNWEIVISKFQGKTHITLRGPETRATTADFGGYGEYFGIVFKMGTFMPNFPLQKLLDRNDLTLPEAGRSQSFWLNGEAWQLPTFDNADTFVERLVRDGLVMSDPLVSAALNDQPLDYSIRTVRRRFLQATGLTHSTIRQIQRARYAMSLLQQGVPILDTVFEAGYFDQPHLTRALKYYIGQTPAQIIGVNTPVTVLYNPDTPMVEYDAMTVLYNTSGAVPGYDDSMKSKPKEFPG